jgi:hypothetical protein
MPKAENYQQEAFEIGGVKLTITTYQIGDKFYCHIENRDPGATISRADGNSREAAREAALSKARERLK